MEAKEKPYYLAKNGLEYPVYEDAETYGGGAVAIRKEIPASKQYVKIDTAEIASATPTPVETPKEDIYAQAKALGIKNPKIYKEETLKAKIEELITN